MIPWVCNNLGRFAMPWNEADRVKYEVIRDRYSTDMSDVEFELILPLLPATKKLGREPNRLSRRPERGILHDPGWLSVAAVAKDFPPFTTVQNRFYAWRDSGLWPQIISVFVMAAREAEGREPAPTAVVVDSQSQERKPAGRVASTRARVRPDGAYRQWRKVPPRELSMDLVADERFGWVTGRAEAS